MYCAVTPWPPQRNGIADYSFEIARHTPGGAFVATQAFSPHACEGVQFLDAARLRTVTAAGMPTVYHIGNNPDHAFLVPMFLEQPGLAVVHDLSLHYLAEQVEGRLPGFFEADLRRAYGKMAEPLLRLWRSPTLKRLVDYREAKFLGWLAGATGFIVHSHYAARILRAQFPATPLHVVPHFAYPPPYGFAALAGLREAARAALEIAPGTLCLTAIGFATRNKQYDAILRAIASLPPAQRARVLLYVAGEVRPHEYDLLADIRKFGCTANVRLAGYLSESHMQRLLLAGDLMLNLRYPTFGESSGAMNRALGMGCGVAVSEGGAYAELPDEVCVKLPARADPSDAIAQLLTELLENPSRLGQLRVAAYDYAQTTLAPARAAARYAALAGDA
jgi:glycosyltransferase involved in cell wall biosynthesis